MRLRAAEILSSTQGFFAAQAMCVLFGAAIAWHPAVRPLTVLSRIGVAYIAGVVLLTVEAMLFTLCRLPWSAARLAIPLVLLSAAGAWRWSRLPSQPSRRVDRSGLLVAGVAIAIIALAGLIVSVAAGDSAIVDYVYFWGVKAVRFAFKRAIDTDFLKLGFSLHAHPNYPPLVPVDTAWSILVSGAMPWTLAPIIGCFWIAAAVPILFDLLRQWLPDDKAMLVVAFWITALSRSLIFSGSAGGGEMHLVAALAIASAALIVHRDEMSLDVIAIAALAAALLAKLEGALQSVALLFGALAARHWRREEAMRLALILAIAIVPLTVWWLLELVTGVPLTDPGRQVFETSFANLRVLPWLLMRNMHGGAYGIAWIVAIVCLVIGRKSWREVMPALSLIATMFAFAIVYYLHINVEAWIMVRWTFPRLSQPALSAAIIAAGVVTFERRLSSARQ